MLTSCSISLNSIRKGPQSTLGFHCRSVSLQLWPKEDTPTNSRKAPGEGKRKEEEATARLAHAEEVSMDAAESRLAFSCSKDVLRGMAWLTLSGKNYVKHPDSVQCSRVQLRSNLAATKKAELLGSLTEVARKKKERTLRTIKSLALVQKRNHTNDKHCSIHFLGQHNSVPIANN